MSPLFYCRAFLFLREFYIRIKGTDDGYTKIRQDQFNR